MKALIDTNVLLAYSFVREPKHDLAVAALRSLGRDRAVIAAPVVAEVFLMTALRLHYRAAVDAFGYIRRAFTIVDINADDMERMQTIMLQYASAEFDYTDAAIMALAERLGITQVYTFDRRDFTIFRPAHCEHLQLLP